LLEQLLEEQTRGYKLHFATLFSRMAFVFQQKMIAGPLQAALHHFRKASRQRLILASSSEERDHLLIQGGIRLLAALVEVVYQQAIPLDIDAAYPPIEQFLPAKSPILAYYPSLRAVVEGQDEQHDQLIARIEAFPDQLCRIQYNLADRNESFQGTIQAIQKVVGFPCIVQLLEVEVDEKGVLRPRAIVLDPDHLIDISRIAELIKPEGTEPNLQFLRTYLPYEVTPPLLLGNIANHFLDELMVRPEATYRELIGKVFQLAPLAFSQLQDAEVRKLAESAKSHFLILKQTIHQQFDQADLDRKHSFLEPTFYSKDLGIQGRLDIFFQSPDRTGIVELKSGKPFKANRYGLSLTHYVQTLLYDLLIRSVFGESSDPINYILYSSQAEKSLRFAPRVKAQQYDAIEVRNLLVGLEHLVAQTFPTPELLESPLHHQLLKLRPDRYFKHSGFIKRDLGRFYSVYTQLSSLEQKYFLACSGFIAREHKIAKTGIEGNDRANGQAALWLQHAPEKQAHFQLLGHLQLLENCSDQSPPLLTFARTEETHPLANFRKGDIVVVYATPGEGKAPVHQQLHKGTVVKINQKTVQVRLRYRQFNPRLFDARQAWFVEHDQLDSSFYAMYRSLFAWAESPANKRAILLGQEPPGAGLPGDVQAPVSLTGEQGQIFSKMIQARDYFLLWGPPGTGKTSRMLRAFVEYILKSTSEDLLLLAYTNRAVDEICEAIHDIGELAIDQYLR
ncbi:MAG: AAA domain-containing protein, partial [Bacteroidota bacterium]